MTPIMTDFTFQHDAVADSALVSSIERIVQKIKASSASSKIQAVVLGGGYGRGEGGCTKTHSLYNDLDFFVFPLRYPVPEPIRHLFHTIAEQEEQVLHIDVDFFFVPCKNWLKHNEETMMVQELLAGHRVVWGPSDFLDSSPRRDWSQIPWQEGARLLLNRGTGLLLAQTRIADPVSNQDFILRNINKAYLGCGDALLIAAGQYRQKGMERLDALNSLSNIPSSLAEKYRIALQFKYQPDLQNRDSTVPLETHLDQAIHCWDTVLTEFCHRLTGLQMTSPDEALDKLLSRHTVPFGNPGKNLILSLLYARQLTCLFPLTEHPRLKLLKLLLRTLHGEKEVSPYLRLWKKFN